MAETTRSRLPDDPMRKILLALLSAAAVVPASAAVANTSHDGWPRIDGVLFMNKDDSDRPLDARAGHPARAPRPGHAPCGRRAGRYSCDTVHLPGACQPLFVSSGSGFVMPAE